ncbi:hypothetical protein TrST_g12857 [Triparma strigata]|uniref:Uncharacterized protein n=1 Tax=Triparma strigata TaxID=1606541 RepID=A0A9W7C382_9STRA|nr:hypothetical protein TrST_g12857 [Triparma strigata]
MFDKGTLVVVAARTWPGINKPGGVGKIILSTPTTCNVKYILGGTDKEIPLEFVKRNEDLGSREKKQVEKLNIDVEEKRERRNKAPLKAPAKAVSVPKVPARKEVAREEAQNENRDTNQVAKKQKSQPAAKKARPKSTPSSSFPSHSTSSSSKSSSHSSSYSPLPITEALSTPLVLPTSPPPCASPQLSSFTNLLNSLFDLNDGEANVEDIKEKWKGDVGDLKRMMGFLEGQNRIFVSEGAVYKV